MSDLNELYQEILLEHNSKPRNFRKLDQANHTADGFNPLCGDQISLYLQVEDGVITDAEIGRTRKVRAVVDYIVDLFERDRRRYFSP